MYQEYQSYLLNIRNSLIQCGVEITDIISQDTSDYYELYKLGIKLEDILYFYKVLAVSGSEYMLEGFFIPLNETYKDKMRGICYEEFSTNILPDYKSLIGDDEDDLDLDDDDIDYVGDEGDSGESEDVEEVESSDSIDLFASMFTEDTGDGVADAKKVIEDVEYVSNGIILEDLVGNESDSWGGDEEELEGESTYVDDDEYVEESEYIDDEDSDVEESAYVDYDDYDTEESAYAEDEDEYVEESDYGDSDIEESSYMDDDDEYLEESAYSDDEEEYEESPYTDDEDEYLEESEYSDDEDYEESPYTDDEDEYVEESPFTDEDDDIISSKSDTTSSKTTVNSEKDSNKDVDLGDELQNITSAILTNIKRGVSNFLNRKD